MFCEIFEECAVSFLIELYRCNQLEPGCSWYLETWHVMSFWWYSRILSGPPTPQAVMEQSSFMSPILGWRNCRKNDRAFDKRRELYWEWLWYHYDILFLGVCVYFVCINLYDMHIGMCLFLHIDLTNSKIGFHPCIIGIFSRPEVVCLWDHLALVRPSWPRSAEDMVRSKNPRKHVSVLYNYCRWFGHSWPEDVNYIV